MKLVLLAMGKTDSAELEKLIGKFAVRLGRYVPFEMECLPDIRLRGNPDPGLLRDKEAEALLRFTHPQDTVWLLDENGREYTSREFATRIQKCMNAGPKRLVFVIGGAYGFGTQIRERADARVSLSRMTFNHQVVRLMAAEQLYRAFSILRGDPYHND